MKSWRLCLNSKGHVTGVFWDLAKTSDCFNEEILPIKLIYYGTGGNTSKWFASQLANRRLKADIKKKVYFNQGKSEWNITKLNS
jgi:hypothetical protein